MPPHARRLTPAKRRLAEENVGLIEGAVNTFEHLWPNNDRDEAVGIATDAFMRAVAAFDPARGRLSTLVYSCTRRALCGAITTARRKAGHRRTYTRELARRRPYAEPDQGREPIDVRWLEALDDRTRRIVEMRAEGMTLQGIGDTLGITREAVRQIISKRARPVAVAWLEVGGELEGA